MKPTPVLFAINILGATALAWALWGYLDAPRLAAFVYVVFMGMILHAMFRK